MKKFLHLLVLKQSENSYFLSKMPLMTELKSQLSIDQIKLIKEKFGSFNFLMSYLDFKSACENE